MTCFSIQNSLDEKTIGKLPQVKSIKHNCHIRDEPNFIDRFPFEEIEINPNLSHTISYGKSKKKPT
jgi:hypothetical protein